MVHPGGTTIPLDEILGRLVRGDVVTHVITAGVKARWHLGRVRASAQRWIGG
jgi:predicted amidohydrolase